MFRRNFPLSMRQLRAFALFLGSAVLAFASVWIAEKEFAPMRTPAPMQIAHSINAIQQDESQGLANKLTPGMRAMSVKVNEVAGVAGFALPGSLVDVMVNTQEAQGLTTANEHSISKIILEKVLVLAVAQETHQDDKKPKVVNAVTLEVTPEQAELLDLARNVGTLSLVLRNQADLAVVPSTGVSRQSLLAGMPASSKFLPQRAKIGPHLELPHYADATQDNEPEKSPQIELIKGSERIAFFSTKAEGHR